MKSKKDSKSKSTKQAREASQAAPSTSLGTISSKADLEAFLLNVRDKMDDESASAVYALTAMNYVMSLPEVYSWFNNETKEIARDIWLRLKLAGLQIRNPPMLFGEAEDVGTAG